MGREVDSIVSGEKTGVDIDLRKIEELESHLSELVLLGAGARDIGIDQSFELL